jgi:hypothetical protein
MPSRRIEHTTLPPHGMKPISAAPNGENLFAIRYPMSTQLAAIDSCTQLATRVPSFLVSILNSATRSRVMIFHGTLY